VPKGTPIIHESIKTFIPIGGVIAPISIILTIITPYYIRSNPMATTIGNMMGRVRRMEAITLRNIPRITNMTIRAVPTRS
jgi:hypothetical protein